MSNFIPDWLELRQAEGVLSGSFDSAGLFLDISGFTRMTESFVEHGKQGAEALSKVINTVFSPVLEAIYRRGGFVTTFAGDALTALFQTKDGNPPQEQALDAALEVAHWFLDHPLHKTPWGEFLLQAKVGLGQGSVEWQLVGESNRRGYSFRGPAVESCALAEHVCPPGHVAMAAGLAPPDPRSASLTGENDGVRIWKPATGWRSKAILSSAKGSATREFMAQFVPVDHFPSDSPGEFRAIACVFLLFDEAHTPPAEVFDQLSPLAAEKGGYWNLMDSGDKGGVVLVLFGAPITLVDAWQGALDFSLEAITRVPGLRVGMNEGSCFVGYVGTPLRQTYTALGSAVNLAARLAGSAENGTVLVTQDWATSHTGALALTPLDPKDFKGFAQPVAVAQVTARLRVDERASEDPSVGREADLSSLTEWLSATISSRGLSSFLVYGEAGSGKSLVVAEALKQAGVSAISLVYDPVVPKNLSPFVALFRDWIDKTPPHELSSSGADLSALRHLAGLASGDTAFDALDAEARHVRTIEALVDWFCKRADESGLILVVDHAQALDTSSVEFWKRLLANQKGPQIAVIFLARSAPDSLESLGIREKLELRPLGRDAVAQLVRRTCLAEPDSKLVDFLILRTGAVPIYLVELLRYLRDRGWVTVAQGQASLAAVEPSALPATLNDLILAHADRLPPALRRALPRIAVWGTTWPQALLTRAFGDEAEPLLQEGIRQDLFSVHEDRVTFVKGILRDSLYQLQLGDTLASWHRDAAQMWEALFPELPEAWPEKAYHFDQAGDKAPAATCYHHAAVHARREFSNDEALRYYHRFLELLSEADQKAEVRMELARIHELTGNWDQAIAEVERGLGVAVLSGQERLYSRFFWLLGQLLFKRGDSAGARKSFEKAIREPHADGLGPEMVQCRIDLARVFLLEGAYPRALAKLTEARDLAVESGFRHEEALALYYLGVALRSRNRKKDALKTYAQSLQIFRELGDQRYITYPLYDMSLINQAEGRLVEALENMESAREIYQRIGYKSGLGAALLNLGAIEDQRGNFEEGRKYFQQSRQITVEIGEDLGTAYALFSLGASTFKSADYAQALSYLLDAHSMVTRLGAQSYLGYALSYLAHAYVRLERDADAVATAAELLDVITRTGNDVEKGRVWLALAEVAARTSVLDDATRRLLADLAEKHGVARPTTLRFLLKALAVAVPAEYVNTSLPALFHMGRELLAHGKTESAAKYLRRALEGAQSAGWERYARQIETTLSTVEG